MTLTALRSVLYTSKVVGFSQILSQLITINVTIKDNCTSIKQPNALLNPLSCGNNANHCRQHKVGLTSSGGDETEHAFVMFPVVLISTQQVIDRLVHVEVLKGGEAERVSGH